MNGTSKELVGVQANGTPISSIYNGDVLVWSKQSEVVNPYAGKFAGKFVDGTSASLCYYEADGRDGNQKQVQFSNYSNREFSMDVNFGTKLDYLFSDNMYIEDVYNIVVTSKIVSMREAFSMATSLKHIHCDNWDCSNVTNMQDIFTGSTALSSITGSISNIRPHISLASNPLDNDSAMVLINGLKDYSGTGSSRTITFRKSTYDTLTDEQKAIATSKGWTVASK